MLYDQAMIVLAALDVFQVTGEDAFKEIVDKTLTYVMRDMQHEKGGFYSAEDADSEGVEGKFYVWSVDEVNTVLDSSEAELFSHTFNLKPAGNFFDEATGALTGQNIPHLHASFSSLAEQTGVDVELMKAKLETARKKLFAARKKRIHPLKDDKVLTDWNGLMIAAMARAGEVLGEEKYVIAAEAAAAFVNKHLLNKDGRPFHRFRKGYAGLQSNLDDYAFFTYGLPRIV